MEVETAFALALFINERGTCSSAGVLPFGNRGWVIVADKQTDKILEPIADPQDYLRRARSGILKIEDAYHDLIEQWIIEG
jgi:hypothetical protein